MLLSGQSRHEPRHFGQGVFDMVHVDGVGWTLTCRRGSDLRATQVEDGQLIDDVVCKTVESVACLSRRLE